MVRGQTLAVLLVAVLVIAIVAAFVLLSRQTSVPKRSGQPSQTTYGAAMQRAREVECMNNLHQIRSAIQMFIAENGSNPPDLSSLRLPPTAQPLCPLTQTPYTYDPNTGAVKCPKHFLGQ